MQASAAVWELFICSSEEMRQKARERNGFPVFWEVDYPLSLSPRHYVVKANLEYEERIRERREREKRERESKESGEVEVEAI
ncbi:MAG: hypothetical protein JWP44_4220 [Mucilaginibacter sp.]|nr:hypothetical protein [Mucilaginibacter sp.]